MLKNWMIFILIVLVILSNLWREHQVEAMMERGEQRYEQAVLEDQMKIDHLQYLIATGVVKCGPRRFRQYNFQYCAFVVSDAK